MRGLFPGTGPLSCILAGLFCTMTIAADIPVTGADDPRLKPIDDFMSAFVQEHDAPGASLAISRHGKLVYARGFGYADVEKKQPVQPNALFRIASVSKPVTGTAVMQLIERGKIHLEDRPFEILGLKPLLVDGDPVDARIWTITVAQLLHHTGGFDRGASFDPMFRSVEIAKATGVAPPAGQKQIIEYVMGRPLDFEPGAKEAYSNFGYCVLGRLIEHVTGMNYDDYVKREVLAPLGIQRMRMGRSWPKDRAEGEVHYYGAGDPQETSSFGDGKEVPVPYGGWCIETMDSHGGWIASAPELVRLASSFDDSGHCPILKPATIEKMFRRPEGISGFSKDGKPNEVWYASGWFGREAGNGKINVWHGGLLSGTSTQLVRRHDGFCWAVLFNTDADKKKQILSKVVDPLVHRAVDSVKEWPQGWNFKEP